MRYSMIMAALMLVATGIVLPKHVHAETKPYLSTTHVSQKPVEPKQEYWIVTNEIAAKATEKTPAMEVYRWDPGFLVVEKDKPVTLHFYGVKGKEHPFEIIGLGVKGNVVKGKVTTVTFTPKKAGTYPIVCLTHPSKEKNGPMVGYLRVEESK